MVTTSQSPVACCSSMDQHVSVCFRLVKVKPSPKCNLGFICECIRVKPACKSIITMKEVFNLTGRRVMVDRSSSLPVRSHLGIDAVCLPWRRRARDPAANVSSSKTFIVCAHKQCSQCLCSWDPGDTTSKVSCCVEPSKCLKSSDFDASVPVPLHSHWKLACPKTKLR